MLRGIVTDLYVDQFKLRGQRVKNKERVDGILDNYSFDKLIEVFKIGA